MELKPFIFIDLFCGAGGTTTGLIKARVQGEHACKVIACVNHDPIAIASHASNHKGVMHFIEDIRTLDLTALINLVNEYRITMPGSPICIWASLECTNFSRAKGGLPRNADSRTLADHLVRYIEQINPDYVYIENVEEFMSWGTLDDKGKPVSKHSGEDYEKWIVEMCRAGGFRYDFRILNSADYGAHTSRKRFFAQFAKTSLPIAWPLPTHSKNSMQNLFGGTTKKWRPVKECLDFSDEGESIFLRKKALSSKTMARIYAGLIKYVAGGKKAFIQKYYSTDRPQDMVKSVDDCAGTIKCKDGQGLVTSKFLVNYNHSSKAASMDEAAPTIMTHDKLAPVFLTQYYGGGGQLQDINNPSPALVTKDRIAVVKTKYFLDRQFTQGTQHQSVETPAGALLTVPKMNLTSLKYFIDNQYGKSKCASVDDACSTITKNPKQALIEATPFIMDTQFGNVGQDINKPLGVITANRKHHYIMNPQWVGNVNHVDEPCPTIIARQDKSPLYLVECQMEIGSFRVPVYDDDCENTVLVKQFMAAYGIIDIKMRMLRVTELLKIQGFPKWYKLQGTQADQKKFIGNSVVPKAAQSILEASVREYNDWFQKKKAVA